MSERRRKARRAAGRRNRRKGKPGDGQPLWFLAAVGAVVVFAVLLTVFGLDRDDGSSGSGRADGTDLVAGKKLFEGNCAQCHGVDLRGTNTGPPFLSPVYAPNHHSDEAFLLAAQNGVQPHHWGFGPMPPVRGLSDEQVQEIVAYVRSVQIEEGITRDPTHG